MKTTILDQKYGFILEACTIIVPDKIEKLDALGGSVNNFKCDRLITIVKNDKFTVFIGLNEFNNYAKIHHNYACVFSEENTNLYSLINDTMKFLQTSNII